MNTKLWRLAARTVFTAAAAGIFAVGCNVANTLDSDGLPANKQTVSPGKGNDQGDDNNDQGENGKGKNTCSSGYDVSDVIYKRGPGLNDFYDSYRFPHHSGSSEPSYWEYYDYFVIKSETEKNELIARWETAFEERGWWGSASDPFFNTLLEEYNDNYFKNNNLVMILRTEGSGSYRNEVESAVVKNNELNISMNRWGGGSNCAMTDDMAYWYILVPVKKCFFNGDKVDVKIVNKIFPECM